MKTRKILALLTVVVAVALSAPGCGKKDEKKPVVGGVGAFNGFQVINGVGQATLLSYSSCYRVPQAADGSISFPVATHPSDPHTLNGYLSASLYVSAQLMTGGNSFTFNNTFSDTINFYSYGPYMGGSVRLSGTTVGQIKNYLRTYSGRVSDSNASSLCVDGVLVTNAYLNGNTIVTQPSSGGKVSVYIDNIEFQLNN